MVGYLHIQKQAKVKKNHIFRVYFSFWSSNTI